MGKRILLFLVTNFLIVLTMSAVLMVCGVRPYLTSAGLDVWQLSIFCLVWGMSGSLISLAISRWLAKLVYKVEIVDLMHKDPKIRDLVSSVKEYARKSKLPEPEVGIYESKDLNAFATGPSKSRSLVCVSTGLLEKMNRDQLNAVLGHEVAHIANGDMVTMALLQGVVNAFVMFLSRAIAFAVTMTGDEEDGAKSRLAYYVTRFVLEMVFAILGAMVVAWFSRQREYRADAGGAELAGRLNMANALDSLRMADSLELQAARRGQPMAAFMITGADWGIFGKLLSTHPPLEDRINKLLAPGEEGLIASAGELPKRSTEIPRSSNSLRDRFSSKDI